MLLLTRWPFISAGWLHFVSLHHIFTLVFFCLSSFLTTQVYPGVLRAYALIWLSNAMTTGPIVIRSFTGSENDIVVVLGILGQRCLRWGSAIAAVVEMSDEPRRYFLQQPYMHILGAFALLLLEVLDVSSQWKKVKEALWRKSSDDKATKTLLDDTQALTLGRGRLNVIQEGETDDEFELEDRH